MLNQWQRWHCDIHISQGAGQGAVVQPCTWLPQCPVYLLDVILKNLLCWFAVLFLYKPVCQGNELQAGLAISRAGHVGSAARLGSQASGAQMFWCQTPGKTGTWGPGLSKAGGSMSAGRSSNDTSSMLRSNASPWERNRAKEAGDLHG